ncbi:MAG: hypothetical protein GY859_01000 [Desulfobacterales bacterium]|nr:hypothetical protein [Desulfobacterales bacterium]
MACDQRPENVVELKIDFKWNPPCSSLYDTPEITIDAVPEGTARFFVEMIDTDLPSFDHGSGFADYHGEPVIPRGAVKGSYKGPTPPERVIHDYEFTVEARDKDNKTLGIGKKIHTYPPKGEEKIRWAMCK